MSFVVRKKKFRFLVNFEVEELSSVPIINGMLFAKIRMLDGCSFCEVTKSCEVKHYSVRWRKKFRFQCKMSAGTTTGVLDSCVCRVSVRKEVKGGKSSSKIGFVDLNLAEFAGAGKICRRCLLEGYDSSNRQDNSILKVNIELMLLSGDPCFKTPPPKKTVPYLDSLELDADATLRPEMRTFDSPSLSHTVDEEVLQSQQCGSTSKFTSHSRSSSYTEHMSTVVETASLGSTGSDRSSIKGVSEHRRKSDKYGHRRVNSTRVDADDVIEQIMTQQDLSSPTDSNGDECLQLYITKDGSTALGGQKLRQRLSAHTYKPVVLQAEDCR